MIIAISFEKRGHIVDHNNTPHKSFTFVEVTETVYRKLVARSRYAAEAHEFLEGIRSEYEEKYVRQHARNAGLSGDGDLEEVRVRLVQRVMENSKDLLDVRAEHDAFDKVRATLVDWTESMRAVAPEPPAATKPPEKPPAEDTPEPELREDAWQTLKQAVLASDYKGTRSALAALSEEPTPSKAADLYAQAAQLLDQRGLLSAEEREGLL